MTKDSPGTSAISRVRLARAFGPTVRGLLPLAPVLIAAALISSVIVTLGAPLLPSIQQRFGVSEESAQWSYTITLLVAAACTPLLGRLSDGRQRRLIITLVCALVSVGCLVAAVAQSFPALLVGRGLQGLGVSLVAMTIAVARAGLSGRRARSTLAILSITTALGAGVSYPLTTAITDHLGMSAAFGIASCFAALVGIAVVIRIPSAPDRPARGPDLIGTLLLATGVTALLLVITTGNSRGWLSGFSIGLTTLSVALIAGWAAWEARAADPLIKLGLLRDRRLLAADAVAFFMGASLYSIPVLVTRIAQLPSSTGFGTGLSLTVAGTIMIPIAVGNLAGSRLSLMTTRRFGPRTALSLGASTAMAGAVLLAVLQPGVPLLVLAMTLTAIGAGATFGAMPALVIAAVPEIETGSSMSFNVLLRTVGGTVGSAATGAALGAFTAVGSSHATWGGYRLAFLLCATSCLLAVIASLVLLRVRAGAEPGRRGARARAAR